jgi:hypothetical protein
MFAIIAGLRRRDSFKAIAASAVAWPIAAYAQQSKIPIVGVLWHAGKHRRRADGYAGE